MATVSVWLPVEENPDDTAATETPEGATNNDSVACAVWTGSDESVTTTVK
jgi:hypothetical protein